MPISYVSKVQESNPYVLPVDINLMEKVNSYKQSIFYKNADEIRTQFGELQNADIANPDIKGKLTDKYNNLASQIQGMGGIDYSDMNVSHQIEGFGADIYKDPQILNGIVGTKMGRKLQEDYDKMKTDPKLSKYYAPSNEWVDMQPFQEFIHGGLTATYKGESAPTPYNGNPAIRLQEAIAKIKPNVEVHYGDSGIPFFIDKTSGESVDSKSVYAAIDATVSGGGDILNQISIDGRYAMRDMDHSQVFEQYKNIYTNKRASLNAAIEYNKNLIASQPSLVKQAEYKKSLEDNQNALAQLDQNYKPDNFISKSTDTPDQIEQKRRTLQNEIYSTKLFDDMIMSSVYTKKKTDLIVNRGEIEQLKIAAKVKAAKAAKEPFIDPNLETYVNNKETPEQAKSHEVTVDSLNTNIQALSKTINDNIKDLVIGEANLNHNYAGVLDVKTSISSDPSTKPTIESSDLLAKIALIDKDPNLSISDIRKAIADPTMLNPIQKQFFTHIINQYDAITEGKGGEEALKDLAVNKNNLISTLNNVRWNEMAISGKKTLIEKYTKQVADNVLAKNKAKGMTEDDSKLLSEYYKNPSSFEIMKKVPLTKEESVMGGFIEEFAGYNNQRLTWMSEHGILDNIGENKKEINDLLKNTSDRLNYKSKTFNTEWAKKSGLGAYIRKNSPGLEGKDVDDNDIIPEFVEQIPGENQFRLSFQYKDGKTNPHLKDVVLDGTQVKEFGITPIPYPQLEEYVYEQGVSPKMYLRNPNLPGTDGLFSYDIKNIGNGRNDNRIAIRIYDKDGFVSISKGYITPDFPEGKPFESANEAYAFANDKIPQLSNVYGNRQQFLDVLRYQALNN